LSVTSQTVARSQAERAAGLPSLGEAFWIWARVAALSFGGPAGQIAVMHRTLVEEKRWIGEDRFLHALNYCMLLPGPEAHQLAVYIGWLLHKTRGGILAGTLFVLPGVIALGALSLIYAAFGTIAFVQGLFFGLKSAVLALVLQAVIRVGGRALKTRAQMAVAAAAFAALAFFALPFPLVILGAALVGLAGQALHLSWFQSVAVHGTATQPQGPPALIDAAFAEEIPAHVKPSALRFVLVLLIGLAVWFSPLFFLLVTVGSRNAFVAVAAFNAKMAVVTFGGAYAVLAYMAQQAVEYYHWLKPGEMLVGLGFAEATPGPLISVVQFVGFMAVFRQPGALDPLVAGTIGGLLAMWMTFVPSFLWIFLGGPYVESLIANKSLNAALTAITAAVVGVILNLALWFGLHTLFARTEIWRIAGLAFSVPITTSIDWAALAIALAAIIAIFRFKIGLLPVLGGSTALGALYFSFTH